MAISTIRDPNSLGEINGAIASANTDIAAANTEIDDVADEIPGASISVADEADGTGTITIQLLDAQGDALAARALVRVWVSATALGVPADLGDLAVTTGTTIQTITAHAHLLCLTDAAGEIVITLDADANGAVHANAAAAALAVTATDTISGVE